MAKILGDASLCAWVIGAQIWYYTQFSGLLHAAFISAVQRLWW